AKGLCGIQPDETNPGYKHFIVKPFIVDEVNFAEASVGSPYGEIVSRWERKDNNIILSVTAPPNTTATIYVPASRPADQITESGHSLNIAESVIPKGSDNGYVVVEATSGKYEFVSPFNN
ncbi:MAG: alpha-L-rhamnosidase, partial [Tannerella sp.]|nr:alpha-L-rhamnosidase [Tannerella sp.]